MPGPTESKKATDPKRVLGQAIYGKPLYYEDPIHHEQSSGVCIWTDKQDKDRAKGRCKSFALDLNFNFTDVA